VHTILANMNKKLYRRTFKFHKVMWQQTLEEVVGFTTSSFFLRIWKQKG